MDLLRRLAGGPRARWIWAGITGLLAVGMVVSAVAAGDAVAAGEAKARAQAIRLAKRDVAPALSPSLFDGSPRTGNDQALDGAVRDVTDTGRALAVRIWRADGKPVFAGGAEQGRIVPVFGPVSTAVSGRVVGREVAPAVDAPGDTGSVYEVFVPVKVGDRKNPAVVEVEIMYARILGAAQSSWPLVRTIVALVFALSLGLLISAWRLAAPDPRRSPSETPQPSGFLQEDVSPLVGRSASASASAAAPVAAAAAGPAPAPTSTGPNGVHSDRERPPSELGPEPDLVARLESRVAELEAQLERSERARLDLLAISPRTAETDAGNNGGPRHAPGSGHASGNGNVPSMPAPATEPDSPALPAPPS